MRIAKMKPNIAGANAILTIGRGLRLIEPITQLINSAVGFGRVMCRQKDTAGLVCAAKCNWLIERFGKKSTVQSQMGWFSITSVESALALIQIIYALSRQAKTRILARLCEPFLLGEESKTRPQNITFNTMPAIQAASRAAAITPIPLAGAARAIGGDDG